MSAVRERFVALVPGNPWKGRPEHSAMGPRFTTALQLGFGGSSRPRQETPPDR